VNFFLKPHRGRGFTLDETRSGTVHVWMVRKPLSLGHSVRLVNAESIHTAVKPKTQDFLER
jgi:hypothetical protein